MARAAALLLSMAVSASAVDGGKARYIGGTLPGVKEKTEGPIELKGEDLLIYHAKDSAPIEIPWANVIEVEYGQKAGRRVVSAVLISPVALFMKKRQHYVTVSYTDTKGKEQAAVFEFDKSDIRTSLAIIHARIGKEIICQDEEAMKQMGMGGKLRVAEKPETAGVSPAKAPASQPTTESKPAEQSASKSPETGAAASADAAPGTPQ